VVTDRATLHEMALALVRTLFPLRAGIRLIGVTLSTFDRDGEESQLDLLREADASQ
jgi:DNA polymerase-4